MSKQAISLAEAKSYLKTKGYPLIEIDTHGYVALIGHYGSDESICQTARMTTNSEGQGIEGLIRYLIRHKHTSPFEDSLLEFEVALPRFVENQWVRHRTAGLNEVSGRYCELHCETWEMPDERICGEPKSGNSRQGSGEQLPPNDIEWIQNIYDQSTQTAIAAYKQAREMGLSCEVSRTILPVSFYTRKRWWCNLHNILHFLELRLDQTAQKEIRDYAEAVAFFTKEKFPITYKAFEDYRLEAVTFSKHEKELLRSLLINKANKDQMEQLSKMQIAELSKTEMNEFLKKLEKCGLV